MAEHLNPEFEGGGYRVVPIAHEQSALLQSHERTGNECATVSPPTVACGRQWLLEIRGVPRPAELEPDHAFKREQSLRRTYLSLELSPKDDLSFPVVLYPRSDDLHKEPFDGIDVATACGSLHTYSVSLYPAGFLFHCSW